VSDPQKQTTEARVAELERVERSLIDRTDRILDQAKRLETKMEARFIDLEGKMDTAFSQIQQEQRVMMAMIQELRQENRDILALLNDRLPPKEQ
jgi:phage host-nuclease inhibitor protein Gam